MKEKQSRKTLKLFVSISLMLLIILTASMLACAPETPTPTPTPSQPTTPTPPPVKPVTLVFSHHDPKGGLWDTELYSPFFAELEKRTGGAVKVEAHFSGELASLFDAYGVVAKGTVDMAHFNPPMVPGKFPLDEITTFNSYNVFCYRASRVHWELHKAFPEMDKPYTDGGVKLILKAATYPNYTMTTKRKSIRNLAENKGAKMIILGGWDGKRAEALGRTPIGQDPAQTYTSMQTGVVDGFAVPFFVLWDFKWGDVIKYVDINVNERPGVWAFAMNLKSWSSLSADNQKIIMELGEKYVDVWDLAMLRTDRDLREKGVKEFGFEYITVPDIDKWVEVDKPVWDAFAADLEAKGMPGKKLVAKYLELESKYAAKEYALK